MQNTQAIDTFLESWRKASFNYYQDLANEQNKLFDKKNEMNNINFTLLKEIGTVSINNFIDEDYIFDALKF